jgi:triacylglycerol lipase
VLGNSAELAAQLHELTTRFGAKKCHIIAHSKGGLDTFAYLVGAQYHPDQLTVSSVHTLSTPFRGSILADILLAARTALNPQSSDPDLQGIITEGNDWARDLPQSPALDDLTIASRSSVHYVVPTGIRVFSYAAIADQNGDDGISGAEAAGLSELPAPLASFVANTLYHVTGSVAAVVVTPPATNNVPIDGTTNVFPRIEVITKIDPLLYAQNGFAYNDCIVTVSSAKFGDDETITGANHISIKSQFIATIIQRILSLTEVGTP